MILQSTIFVLGMLGFVPTVTAKDVSAKIKPKNIDLAVTEKGFEPNSIDVKPGTNVTLKVTRTTDTTCAKQVQVPSKDIKLDLPLNRPVTIALGKLEKGEIRFGCGMDLMLGGVITAQ